MNTSCVRNDDAPAEREFILTGELHHCLGWCLLLAAFALGVWLDPWSLSQRDAAVWMGSPQMYARHAQAVLVGMGFMQLTAARLMCRTPPVALLPRVVTLLCGGTIVYAVSYLAGVVWPAAHGLVPLGAAANLTGLVIWLCCLRRPSAQFLPRVILMMFCLGMLLDVLMGLFAASPDFWQPAFLGPLDGVRMRMLRLARAAVLTLSLLTLLLEELLTTQDRLPRWGLFALLLGAVGMPLLLVIAAVLFVPLKYLLGIPAQAAMLGVVVAIWLAFRRASAWETWGWLVVAFSMAAGLLMGLYAFDGPLPAPTFVGEYNDWNRRLSRLGHAYLIVLGMVCILQARTAYGLTTDGHFNHPKVLRNAGVIVFGAATMLVPILISLVLARFVPTAFLAPGPAVAAVGILFSVWPRPETNLAGRRKE